jgi:hypothetical protein
MIRERRIANPTFTAGGQVLVELPKDAVYHQIQIEIDGQFKALYGSGTRTTDTTLAEGFPFNTISKLRLIRNGSDVVWQGSGKQLAKESMVLNGQFPFARIWSDSASGSGTFSTPGNILTKSVQGVTIPANSEGIGSNNAAFNDTATASVSALFDFRAVLEMWLQLGVDDSYFASLVDARPLASYALEITWANLTDFAIAGTTNSGANVATLSMPSYNCSIQSYDQDNVKLGVPFGTFKRASFQPPGLSYSASGVQALLPRGNLYYGILIETLGYKSAGLSTIAQPGNDILGEIQNRINSNYYLRDVFFRDLQAKNRNDGRCQYNPYDVWGSGPLGWAHLYFPSTGDSIKECVGTYTMDQFDLLLNINASSGAGDGNSYSNSPVINLLTQELIPGKSVSQSSARGAYAGSISATSAKPGT